MGKEGCGEAKYERGETCGDKRAMDSEGGAQGEGRAEVDEASESENCQLQRDSAVAEGGEGIDLDVVGSSGRGWG
jgi:hypothetical protein